MRSQHTSQEQASCKRQTKGQEETQSNRSAAAACTAVFVVGARERVTAAALLPAFAACEDKMQ